jgi:hypothetical protein
MNAWAAHKLSMKEQEEAFKRQRAEQRIERTLLFKRLQDIGVCIAPWSGSVFMWEVLRMSERGGN